MIMTGFDANDFDTSDQLSGFSYPDTNSGYNAAHPSPNVPQLDLTINGNLKTFADSKHILDTGGYDFATWGYHDIIPSPFPQNAYNESFQWRPIGTTGIGNPGGAPPTPEPKGGLSGRCGLLKPLMARRSSLRAERYSPQVHLTKKRS